MSKYSKEQLEEMAKIVLKYKNCTDTRYNKWTDFISKLCGETGLSYDSACYKIKLYAQGVF